MVSFFFFFLLLSSPNLSRRTLDIYHTCTHSVALLCIYNAGLKCAARGSLQIQDAKWRKKLSSVHHRTTSSGYIFAIKAHIDNQKNLLKSNISSTCPLNMANFGSLTAEIGLGVWALQLNGFCVLAPLLHNSLVVGISQTLRHWKDGATYIRQGSHTYVDAACCYRLTSVVCRSVCLLH